MSMNKCRWPGCGKIVPAWLLSCVDHWDDEKAPKIVEVPDDIRVEEELRDSRIQEDGITAEENWLLSHRHRPQIKAKKWTRPGSWRKIPPWPSLPNVDVEIEARLNELEEWPVSLLLRRYKMARRRLNAAIASIESYSKHETVWCFAWRSAVTLYEQLLMAHADMSEMIAWDRRDTELNTTVPRHKMKGRRRPTLDEYDNGIGRPIWHRAEGGTPTTRMR